MYIYMPTFNSTEIVKISEGFNNLVKQVIVQPLSILLIAENEIGFYKLTSNSFANSTSYCKASENN